MTIRNLVTRFRQHGSVADLLSSRPITFRKNRRKLLDVEVSIEDNAKTSIGRHCTELGLSRFSLHRILKHLVMFVYKMWLDHQLHPIDFRQRTECAIYDSCAEKKIIF
nr:unnamed protein product [Callosobruchus analis]